MTPDEQARHLTSPHIDDVCRVTISTIQRLYSTLHGEGPAKALGNRPRDVACNPAVPIEKFDCIATDECHRSIYNLWRQVLEYFDNSLIGLAATPARQTSDYLHQNRVTEAGGKVEKGFLIDPRCKTSRQARAEALTDDLEYTPEDLDRSVVVPGQIRTVLHAYRDVVLTEVFPDRRLAPKTRIFAKDDSHGEDIVHPCREGFGKGNDFCKKITYQAEHTTTGTDIKPLEPLPFLRDPALRDSRIVYEQLKGRGTRVLSPTGLPSVSGEMPGTRRGSSSWMPRACAKATRPNPVRSTASPPCRSRRLSSAPSLPEVAIKTSSPRWPRHWPGSTANSNPLNTSKARKLPAVTSASPDELRARSTRRF